MKVENILAKNISSAGEKASYDAACKRLLANKVILAWIMKSCIEEYRDCEIQEIVENYIEGEADVADVPVNIDEQVSEEQIQNGATEDASIYEGGGYIRYSLLCEGSGVERKNSIDHKY